MEGEKMTAKSNSENGAEGNQEYQEAITALKGYMEESGKSQTQIARELGKSTGLVSSFLSGKYTTPHTMIPGIFALVELNRKKKIAPRAPEYAETSLSRRIENSIAYAHVRGVVTIVYGDAGVGKTTTARAYAEREQQAAYIVARPDCASITGIAAQIATAFGIKERVTRNITDEFISRMQGSGRVLIVDEAQHLTVRALDYLRTLADLCGIGVALLGNDSVYDKMRGKREKDLDQLGSRICIPEHVQHEDISYEDIESIFGGYDIGEDVLKLLHGISRNRAGLRGAVNVYIQVAANGEGISAQEVARTIRYLKLA